jgi:hypothetical protein
MPLRPLRHAGWNDGQGIGGQIGEVREMTRKIILAICALQIVTAWVGTANTYAQQRPDISQADWALKDDPTNPGAAAIILYRETDNDDANSSIRHFYRIKILKDEGKKYADIEIPFQKGQIKFDELSGRTIHPDGRITEFDGTTYDKEVVKARNVSFLAKTFTLPDVQTGSIIEYGYILRWEKFDWSLLRTMDAGYILSQIKPTVAAQWSVQEDLFTKRAHFSFKPIPGFALSWTWSNLSGTTKPTLEKGVVEYDATDIPSFQAEDYIPPESSVKGLVEFFYIFKTAPKDRKDAGWYWKDMADSRAQAVEKFIGKDKSFVKEVNALVSESDSPDAKLRKIYARVQQIRNLSYEPQKSEKEEKREKLRENNSASDVLKHGFGWGNEINDVFVGLARAAGFDAAKVYVAPRNARFFNPNVLDWSQLSANITIVHIDGKDMYFDPATRFCPYGVLPWAENTTHGFRMDKDGSSEIKIPSGSSSETLISRKSTLELAEDGGAKGTFELSFTGQDALQRRHDNRDKDEAGRRKDLEDELKQWFPSGSTVTINEVTGWDDSNRPLTVKLSVQTEGTMPEGVKRMLFPAVPFPGEVKYTFQNARRSLPVYITYGYVQDDDIILQLPKSMRVESVPGIKKAETEFGSYSLAIENKSNSVHIKRTFTMNEGMVNPVYYYKLRDFMTTVRQADENQMVFQFVPSASAGGGR